MKTSLHHNIISGLKIGDKKYSPRHLLDIFLANANKIKEVITISQVFKMNLIYFTIALSIILLLAFIQLFNVDDSIKIVVGFVILFGNVWIIQKNNL